MRQDGQEAPNRTSQALSAESMVSAIESDVLKQRRQNRITVREGKLKMGRKANVVAKKEGPSQLQQQGQWAFPPPPAIEGATGDKGEDAECEGSDAINPSKRRRNASSDGVKAKRLEKMRETKEKIRRSKNALKKIK